MYKKIKIITAATFTLFAMSGSLAFDTLRLGIGLGNANYEIKAKNFTWNEKEKIKKSSQHSSIFLGYDHLINETPLFFGIEGEFSNHNAEKSYRTDWYPNGTLRVSTNNTVNGSLRLGVSTNNVLIYGKAGVAYTNWNVSFQDRTADLQKKYQKYGKVFGGGIECSLNKNFSIGVEHTFEGYNTIERISPILNLKLRPTIQVTKVRLIYSF
jgi:hypothetical protein